MMMVVITILTLMSTLMAPETKTKETGRKRINPVTF